MIGTGMISILAAVAAAALSTAPALAKDKVKVGFIGPLTSGVAANGIGGRNSAELAVKLRNADAKAKYEYEFVVLDDECKPNVGVQVATKMAADRSIIAAATHYCSAVAIGTVETYHKFGLPVIVWGAVLPDITYAQQVPGDSSRQRHDDQPERDRRQADGGPRLQEMGVDPRHHRLRQGPQQVLLRRPEAARRRDRRHLRRDRRPAGLHRRAHPGQGAEPRR